MSYKVFARKWRPLNFAQVVGQEHVVRALVNGLEHDRLHHAYLFTGTRGVGKTTIARVLAKALNCPNSNGAEPCGQCDTCIDVDQGRYPDLIEVDAASRTGVDDTRDLLENVQYSPSRGKYKVYLIDEVHMFSKSS
ncbi:MAG: AAA family ATPase, partial [Cycloclasticus sp.]|nr:AAA family ATPase [Cycloclasticus sp.]